MSISIATHIGSSSSSGPTKKSLLEKFKEFHRANPHVFLKLMELSHVLLAAGATRIGIELVVHQLRWLSSLTTNTNCVYAFDERYKPFYARLLMMTDGTLEGLFKTKATIAWSGRREDLLDCLPPQQKAA